MSTLAYETPQINWKKYVPLTVVLTAAIALVTAIISGFIWSNTTGNLWIVAGMVMAVGAAVVTFQGNSKIYAWESRRLKEWARWSIVMLASSVAIFFSSALVTPNTSVYLVDGKRLLSKSEWLMPFRHSFVVLTPVENPKFEAEAETADHNIVACDIDCHLPLGSDLSKLTTDTRMVQQAQELLSRSFKKIIAGMTLEELHNPLIVENRLFRETDLRATGLQWGDVVKVTGLHVAAKFPDLPKGSGK